MMRIGVAGAGVIGNLRCRAIKEHPETELVAVLDVSKDAAAEAVAGSAARAFTELGAFQDCDMNAVIVSTPPEFHEEVCVGALERGRHVLSEKPLSNTVEAGRRMVDAALAADRVLAVGFNFRYYPFVRFVKQAVENGEIGDVQFLRAFGGHDGLHNFRAEWQYREPGSGGGAMMDIGLHVSDLVRYLLGEISSIYGTMSEGVWHLSGSEDNAIALLRSPAGVPATYHATWSAWEGYETSIEVHGDKGMVRGSYAPMYNLLVRRRGADSPPQRVRRLYPEIMLREKLKGWQSTALLSFKNELRDFLAMSRGEYDVPLADGYDGLRALEVAAAVRRCTSTNEAVNLPELGRMRR